MGWSFDLKRWHRVVDGWQGLAMSGAIAVVGVAAARALAGRDPRSWWLLLGLVPPVYFALAEGAGVI